MGKSNAVWGIEIGQSALKALRCRPIDGDPTRIEADNFDFIEYPQLLSEPGVDVEGLIREALRKFLKHNSVRNDYVAISVAGQKGLTRFVKLPPVESKKIPDIVKFEAKQQIPFPLESVIWDYQKMAGGSEEDGFALETEVGIFAMKREEVFRQLQPFEEADIDVDLIQLTPLALYNFIAFDQMHHLPAVDDYDPDDPPESIVLLSMGCDTTEMVVTNGYRVWQRSIPLGGNNFTKVLMKEFDLTFAKAEHLKRNAASSPQAKKVFQAMRPVFEDLKQECQRSLGFYQNLDRNAKIKCIVGLGNVMKLPGIRTYLEKNLGQKVVRLETFNQLAGPSVVASPQFKENLLSFAACYGLCLQGLAETKVDTNLIPTEIVTDRLIQSKKPWAVVAAAVLLLGFAVNSLFYWRQWITVHDTNFKQAAQVASSAVSMADNPESTFNQKRERYFTIQKMGDRLTANVESRVYWLEMIRAVNNCMPKETARPSNLDPNDRQGWWDMIRNQDRIYIRRMEVEWCEDLGEWYKLAKAKADGALPGSPGANPNAAPPPPPGPGQPGQEGEDQSKDEPPSGPGWIVQLTGHHFHNSDSRRNQRTLRGRAYVEERLIENLKQDRIYLENSQELPIGDLGISHPLLVACTPINFDYNPEEDLEAKSSGRYEPYPLQGGPGRSGGSGLGGGRLGGGGLRGGMNEGIPMSGGTRAPVGNIPTEDRTPITVPRCDFQIQFAWKETPLAIRKAKREQEEREKAEKANQQQNNQQGPTASNAPIRPGRS